MGRDYKITATVYTDSTISTHSPRVGRDYKITATVYTDSTISTHSPRVGRDFRVLRRSAYIEKFQPTLPVWGETAYTVVHATGT